MLPEGFCSHTKEPCKTQGDLSNFKGPRRELGSRGSLANGAQEKSQITGLQMIVLLCSHLMVFRISIQFCESDAQIEFSFNPKQKFLNNNLKLTVKLSELNKWKTFENLLVID